jgi:iron uptake system component EfeO
MAIGNSRGMPAIPSLRRSQLAALLFVASLLGTCAAARVTTASERSSLEAAAANFKPYVLGQIDECLAAVRTLRERIAAADLAGAQRAWLAARGGWESSEVVTAEYFPDLDQAIDAWPDSQRGFHAIESRLFGAHSTDALPAADELVANVTELRRRLRTTTLTAQHLLNGAARLTYEIGENKSGGGESPFSGNSLAEIGDNVAAITAVHSRVLAPVGKEKQSRHGTPVAAELERLRALVAARSLADLDQTALRELSEALASDLIARGRQIGLNEPPLGN